MRAVQSAGRGDGSAPSGSIPTQPTTADLTRDDGHETVGGCVAAHFCQRVAGRLCRSSGSNSATAGALTGRHQKARHIRICSTLNEFSLPESGE